MAIACHDAGGAEILASYLRRSGRQALLALDGPAVSIFARKLPTLSNLELESAIDQASALLCGTSLPSDWERRAIVLAKAAGRPTTAVLDHWINYRERFQSPNGLVLPDTIWTVDDDAFTQASRLFDQCRVVRIDNPYRLDCIEEIRFEEAALADSDRNAYPVSVLYVTQPTSEHAFRRFGDPRHWGYTELEALTYFLEYCRQELPEIRRVVVRPHPMEDVDKYSCIRHRDLEVIVRSHFSLAREIAGAGCVAGCNTMAMVVGTWVGRKVFCSIPPGGRGFNLPIASIKRIVAARDSDPSDLG
jgi:hypothetical protein